MENPNSTKSLRGPLGTAWTDQLVSHVSECSDCLEYSELTPMLSALRDLRGPSELTEIMEHLVNTAALFVYLKNRLNDAVNRL